MTTEDKNTPQWSVLETVSVGQVKGDITTAEIFNNKVYSFRLYKEKTNGSTSPFFTTDDSKDVISVIQQCDDFILDRKIEDLKETKQSRKKE